MNLINGACQFYTIFRSLLGEIAINSVSQKTMDMNGKIKYFVIVWQYFFFVANFF